MEQSTLKIFYLKKRVVFPYCTLTVILKPTTDTKEIKKGDKVLAYTVRTFIDILLYCNGLATLSEVLDIVNDEQSVKIMLKGITRVRIRRVIKFKYADFTSIKQQEIERHELIMEELRKKSQELIFLINVEESDKLIKLLNYILDLNQMTDFISNYFVMDFGKRYKLYNTIGVRERGQLLIAELNELIDKMAKKRKKISP